MQKQGQMLSLVLILVVLNMKLLSIEANSKQSTPNHKISYFQLSNSMNQLGKPTAQAITYNNIDGLNSANVNNDGSFTSNNPGIYFGVFAGQIGSPNRNGEGNIHIWERHDNQDIPNSNSIQSIERGSTSVLVYATVYEVTVGHTDTLIFSAFSDNQCTYLGLIATAPENEPVVPSIIASNIQVSDASKSIPYAQLSSSETQLGDMNSKAVTLNTISLINKIDTTTTGIDGAIKYIESGIYFIIAAAQVGSAINTNAAGEVHLWIQRNGQDVSNSNTIQTISNGKTAVLVSQTIITLQAGDTIKLAFSATNNKLGMIASTPVNEPAVPSIIVGTFFLHNEEGKLPYAQLSSSKTQWACITPTVVELGNNDGSQHIKNNNGVIEFLVSGTYFLIAAAQVGSHDGKGVGDVRLWMRLNDKDMDNSNAVYTVNGDTAVLVSQTVVVLQAGDKVTVVIASDASIGKLGIVTSQPANEPTVPSLIFSAVQPISSTTFNHPPKNSEN